LLQGAKVSQNHETTNKYENLSYYLSNIFVYHFVNIRMWSMPNRRFHRQSIIDNVILVDIGKIYVPDTAKHSNWQGVFQNVAFH
jgi:hypothetical protein